ncbi:ribonuclease HI family protein [Solirubrobacter taibaiensis]|nr:ribonuclease HI family protein [Solirubrobacter taibaiensis]
MRRPRKKGGTLKDGERRQLARTSRHATGPAVAFAPSDRHVLLCDGGSRGNPGTAASAAILVSASGEVVDQHAELIGQASAGEAEYRAILLGLQLARSHGIESLEVRSDSQLAISALRSTTPAPGVIDEIRTAASSFTAIRWTWHPRTANELADALVRDLLWP